MDGPMKIIKKLILAYVFINFNSKNTKRLFILFKLKQTRILLKSSIDYKFLSTYYKINTHVYFRLLFVMIMWRSHFCH